MIEVMIERLLVVVGVALGTAVGSVHLLLLSSNGRLIGEGEIGSRLFSLIEGNGPAIFV